MHYLVCIYGVYIYAINSNKLSAAAVCRNKLSEESKLSHQLGKLWTQNFLTSNIFAVVVAAKLCLFFSSINHKIHHFGRHTLTHTRRRLPNFMKAGLLLCSPMYCHNKIHSWLQLTHARSLRRLLWLRKPCLTDEIQRSRRGFERDFFQQINKAVSKQDTNIMPQSFLFLLKQQVVVRFRIPIVCMKERVEAGSRIQNNTPNEWRESRDGIGGLEKRQLERRAFDRATMTEYTRTFVRR